MARGWLPSASFSAPACMPVGVSEAPSRGLVSPTSTISPSNEDIHRAMTRMQPRARRALHRPRPTLWLGCKRVSRAREEPARGSSPEHRELRDGRGPSRDPQRDAVEDSQDAIEGTREQVSFQVLHNDRSSATVHPRSTVLNESPRRILTRAEIIKFVRLSSTARRIRGEDPEIPS